MLKFSNISVYKLKDINKVCRFTVILLFKKRETTWKLSFLLALFLYAF